MRVLFRLLICVGVMGLVFPAAAQSKVEHLNPSTIHAPKGYSHLVVVSGGTTVYVAGQVALDPKGNLVGAGDLGAQTRQAFENLKAALAAAGLNLTDIVSLTTYVTDISKVDAYRKVRGEYLRDPLPASTLVEVKGLFRPDAMIEISAIAVKR